MVLTLVACRTFQNPDAQVIDLDTKITGAADLTASLLISDVINPDEADAIHAGLKVAKGHADRMREVLLTAKKENRKPTDLELRQASSFRQLARDALKIATQKLAEYEARKENR
jgi:hypothetical protein